MSRILGQKDILKVTRFNDKLLENKMKSYTKKTPILNILYKRINRTPKSQLNKLKQIYNKNYPKTLTKQNNILAKHIRHIPKLIKSDLKYKGSMQIQQKLLQTDYVEQTMGFSMCKDNSQKINNFKKPFKQYESLIYARADYQYINKLSHHNPQFSMLNTRLHTLNGGHTANLPSKFFDRNLAYNNKENTHFMRIEQAYIDKYKQSLVTNIKGKTLIKHKLQALVHGKIDKDKTYKLSTLKVTSAKSNIENPKQIFTYAKNMSNVNTSKALTSLSKSARISPILNYTVKTNIINHHLLPRQVVVDTLQSNGLKHQAKEIKDKAPTWLQRQGNGVIREPQRKVVQKVAHKSWIQYQGITGFLNHYKNINKVLQRAGITPPSDKTKSSNKRHVNNYKHITNKRHKQHGIKKELTTQQKQELRNNMNRIER